MMFLLKSSRIRKDIEILNLGASNDLEYYYLLKEIRDEAINKIESIKIIIMTMKLLIKNEKKY